MNHLLPEIRQQLEDEMKQVTAREQEASMARLRGYLDELPPAIDTRDLRQLLDEYQGTMDCPLFEETKQYFQHRLTTLIERISQIDAESPLPLVREKL